MCFEFLAISLYRPPMGHSMRMSPFISGGGPPQRETSSSSSSSGRWMALAPQKHTSKSPLLEAANLNNSDKGHEPSSSRPSDSPTEGLKIADDD